MAGALWFRQSMILTKVIKTLTELYILFHFFKITKYTHVIYQLPLAV